MAPIEREPMLHKSQELEDTIRDGPQKDMLNDHLATCCPQDSGQCREHEAENVYPFTGLVGLDLDKSG